MVASAVLDASPVSNRVALAYAECYDTITQWQNDIVYFMLEDDAGIDWRYGKHNITNYATDNDSLWAYTDLDVIFDYDDYLHIVWNAQWVTPEGVYWRTYLLHYSEATGEITQIWHHPDSLFDDILIPWDRATV